MTVICLTAMRMGSERLPGKSLIEIAGQPLIGQLLNRLQACHFLDGIVEATTNLEEDHQIEDYTEDRGIPCFRGSSDDVLNRITQAGRQFGADVCVVVYGDGPLIDPEIIDNAVECFLARPELDFLGNDLKSTFPSGMEAEVMTFEALSRSNSLCLDPTLREHGTLFLRQHSDLFRVENFEAKGAQLRPELYLEVDEPQDLTVVESIATHLQTINSYSLDEIISFVDEKRLSRLNSDVPRRWQKFRQLGTN